MPDLEAMGELEWGRAAAARGGEANVLVCVIGRGVR